MFCYSFIKAKDIWDVLHYVTPIEIFIGLQTDAFVLVSQSLTVKQGYEGNHISIRTVSFQRNFDVIIN